MRYILDLILIVVGITGISSNLFDNLFSDILIAFALADNFDRRVKMGPFGHPEIFVPTDNAYSLDGIFAMKREMWNTRGYIAGQVTFRNGLPYEVGRDIFPNALATVVRNGKAYTDYVENIVVVDTRDTRAEVMVQIGDGKMQQAPIVRSQRVIARLEQAISAITLNYK